MLTNKQKLKRQKSQYKKLVQTYNKTVDLYWKAVQNKWTGKIKKYNHKLYIMKKQMINVKIKIAVKTGDSEQEQYYRDVLKKQTDVGKYIEVKSKSFHHRKHISDAIVRSKYEIIENHYDEILNIVKEVAKRNSLSFGQIFELNKKAKEEAEELQDLYSESVWELLKKEGKIVQSQYNGTWLWKISEDEYEVISPL